MSMQETKQKGKKSYAELLEEFANTKKRIAVIYIPLLCEAVRDENSNMSYLDIKERVVSDAVEQGWNEPYIVRCLPSWVLEADPSRDYKHIRSVKSWESRNKNNLKKMHEKAALINQEISEPPEPKEKSYEGEELDLEGGRLATYGDKGKTTSQMKGDITYHAARLFEALTESDHLPYNNEDLIVDYIKPTRQLRKSIILELDEQSRKTVWNSLGAVEAAIQDMLDILEEEIKH